MKNEVYVFLKLNEINGLIEIILNIKRFIFIKVFLYDLHDDFWMQILFSKDCKKNSIIWKLCIINSKNLKNHKDRFN